ncbi:MAG TPA: MmcQ/YjbR family DNA-binding protein [Acidobacteriaceae bacterium]|jgi:hypothetical protein|nr:MmcQ/YjbR family DNA-binding protein [Acidobacteriaceae bacterium]
MTPEAFRKAALHLPDAEEREHMHHPDFRVGGRIFATLGYPSEEFAMVKLFPDQQRDFIAAAPATFVPVKGAWGRQGCTSVCLRAAKAAIVKEALHAAWRNASVRVALRKLEGAVPKSAPRNTAAAKATVPKKTRRRRDGKVTAV